MRSFFELLFKNIRIFVNRFFINHINHINHIFSIWTPLLTRLSHVLIHKWVHDPSFILTPPRYLAPQSNMMVKSVGLSGQDTTRSSKVWGQVGHQYMKVTWFNRLLTWVTVNKSTRYFLKGIIRKLLNAKLLKINLL